MSLIFGKMHFSVYLQSSIIHLPAKISYLNQSLCPKLNDGQVVQIQKQPGININSVQFQINYLVTKTIQIFTFSIIVLQKPEENYE